MAKALLGHLGIGEPGAAQLAAENAALRTRVAALHGQLHLLQEALEAANAVADGRIVDLVNDAEAVPAAMESVPREVIDVADVKRRHDRVGSTGFI